MNPYYRPPQPQPQTQQPLGYEPDYLQGAMQPGELPPDMGMQPGMEQDIMSEQSMMGYDPQGMGMEAPQAPGMNPEVMSLAADMLRSYGRQAGQQGAGAGTGVGAGIAQGLSGFDAATFGKNLGRIYG